LGIIKMLNEVDVYKCIHAKEFQKCKHVFASFLRSIYSILWNSQKCSMMQFTITTDAIFYLLSVRANGGQYQCWHDYSRFLVRSLNDATFPAYLTAKITTITEYHANSPIMAKHSNERILLEIIVKLLKKCTSYGEESDMDVDDNNSKMIEKVCSYFNHNHDCVTLNDVDELINDFLRRLGVDSFDSITNFFENMKRHINSSPLATDSLEEVWNALQGDIVLGQTAYKVFCRHSIKVDAWREGENVFYEFARVYVKSVLSNAQPNEDEAAFRTEIANTINNGDQGEIEQLFASTGVTSLDEIDRQIRKIVVDINLPQTVVDIQNIIQICAASTVKECRQTLEHIVNVCGTDNVINIIQIVQRIKVVYNKHFSEQSFAFVQIPNAIESLIGGHNTDDYNTIPGITISEKLGHVHKNLLLPLDALAPNLTYKDIVTFLTNLVENSFDELNQQTTQAIITKLKRVDSLMNLQQEYDSLQIESESVKERLGKCEEILEKQKSENKDDLIDRLIKENEELKNKVREYGETITELTFEKSLKPSETSTPTEPKRRRLISVRPNTSTSNVGIEDGENIAIVGPTPVARLRGRKRTHDVDSSDSENEYDENKRSR